MTEVEIAWCAGLFEGEGSIFKVKQVRKDRKNNQKYEYNRMSIKMTDLDVLEKFKSKVACGTLRSQSIINQRKVNSNWKRFHVWQLTERDQIARLCKLFYPHLGIRRRAKIIELGILVILD